MRENRERLLVELWAAFGAPRQWNRARVEQILNTWEYWLRTDELQRLVETCQNGKRGNTFYNSQFVSLKVQARLLVLAREGPARSAVSEIQWRGADHA